MLTCTIGVRIFTEATPKQHLEMAAPVCIARRCRETDPELFIENYKTACDKPLITFSTGRIFPMSGKSKVDLSVHSGFQRRSYYMV